MERTPEQQLESFKGSVSWADDAKIQYLGKLPYAQIEDLVLFPVHWGKVNQIMGSLKMPAVQDLIMSDMGLIIDGDCPHIECDRINHYLGITGIHPFWLHAKQKIYWARWVQNLSDGIDIFAKTQKRLEKND